MVCYAAGVDKRRATAEVNSSYTTFFLVSTIGFSFLFLDGFAGPKGPAWFITLGFALLMYFVWDFIKQLYSPGQSVILYFLAFCLLPFLLRLTVGENFFSAGVLTWAFATLSAGLLELLYEGLVKQRAPKRIMQRLLLVDGKLDRSLVRMNYRSESHFTLVDICLVTLLLAAYYALSFALIRG